MTYYSLENGGKPAQTSASNNEVTSHYFIIDFTVPLISVAHFWNYTSTGTQCKQQRLVCGSTLRQGDV
jgi:hypothetical protein